MRKLRRAVSLNSHRIKSTGLEQRQGEVVMTKEEQSILRELDAMLQAEEVRAQILPIVERVRADLAQKEGEVMAWEPIPLSIYRKILPGGIRSSWIFFLRAGTNTGPERHPNSHQRMMSLEARGDMQVRLAGESPWQSNVLESNPQGALQRRWISIPQNVWHQPVVGKTGNWGVVSFHTVAAEELIEERPDPDSAAGTKQMIYLDKKRR